MGNLYLEYLSDINKKLIRNGIRLPVDLSVDNTHIFSQIRILEDYVYFNHILELCDSGHKIESLVCDSEVSYIEWLKQEIKAEYSEVWKNELVQLVVQPFDAGVLSADVKALSSSVRLIANNEDLGVEDKASAISSFQDILALSTPSSSFEDDEEDEDDEEEYEVDNSDFGDFEEEEPKYKSGYDFVEDDDEDEEDEEDEDDDDFGDYSDDEESDEDSEDENEDEEYYYGDEDESEEDLTDNSEDDEDSL